MLYVPIYGFSFNAEDQPVVKVSWEDAKAYADWLTEQNQNHLRFRLPTEAEWEYACRAGSSKVRFWGDQVNDACQYGNVADRSFAKAIKIFPLSMMKRREKGNDYHCDDTFGVCAPVGSFRPNGYGVYDMLGNVWGWCEDSYDAAAYLQHERENPLYKNNGHFHVRRGGSWSDPPNYVRSAVRAMTGASDDTSAYIGFRLVMVVENE